MFTYSHGERSVRGLVKKEAVTKVGRRQDSVFVYPHTADCSIACGLSKVKVELNDEDRMVPTCMCPSGGTIVCGLSKVKVELNDEDRMVPTCMCPSGDRNARGPVKGQARRHGGVCYVYVLSNDPVALSELSQKQKKTGWCLPLRTIQVTKLPVVLSKGNFVYV